MCTTPTRLALAGPETSRLWTPLSSVKVGGSALLSVEAQYSTTFAAYLTRFLINSEPQVRSWWKVRLAEADAFTYDEEVTGIMQILGTERRDSYLASQFSSLVTSVEVGLESYSSESGPASLAAALIARYQRPEQKRSLAQLLSLISTPSQPTTQIAALIGDVDNARIANVTLQSGGAGYGSTAPPVTIASPPTSGGRPARARAVMEPTGRWRMARVVDGGAGYADDEVPEVEISPPTDTSAVPARAVAVIRGGSVVALELISAGTGYQPGQPAQIRIEPPASAAPLSFLRGEAERNGTRPRGARAELVAEFAVAAIELIDPGTGYSADESPTVTVAGPAVEASAGALVVPNESAGRTAFGSVTATAASAVCALTARDEALSAMDLQALSTSLKRAASDAPSYIYVGPATPTPTSVGLPLVSGRLKLTARDNGTWSAPASLDARASMATTAGESTPSQSCTPVAFADTRSCHPPTQRACQQW